MLCIGIVGDPLSCDPGVPASNVFPSEKESAIQCSRFGRASGDALFPEGKTLQVRTSEQALCGYTYYARFSICPVRYDVALIVH
jgi:hypothetical protein